MTVDREDTPAFSDLFPSSAAPGVDEEEESGGASLVFQSHGELFNMILNVALARRGYHRAEAAWHRRRA
ncbi:hypothetical protein [Streptomyces caatingaensis]|uniref:Uncharacterized protein n=1 Tax=Streptomyces caatingaensis TaxID=1678637 RepID=A0A0K9XKV7_9ACTN|nr:hypothetical protein [Streptomyces caatingaensis]KNB53287.1 hypothetical protein AC230_00840 [Streptomyces caatingaensis]